MTAMAAFFDVIVMKQRESTPAPFTTSDQIGLFESDRPILLPAVAAPADRHQRLIARNCSTAQARAIALATPLLQKADRITS